MKENIFEFKTQNDWHDWLDKNHIIEKSVWVVIYKKHIKDKGINYDQALEEALCFGWIDGVMKSIDKDKFKLRFSPRKSNSIWSKINREKSEKLIKKGKMRQSGFEKIEQAKKNGLWEEAYTNKVAQKFPTDLQQALLKKKVANENFHNFANSYRNMYIGWVNSAKTEETRNKRIKKVVELSEKNKRASYL